MDQDATIDELRSRLAAAEALLHKAGMDADLRESALRHRLLIESWAQALWETDAAGVVVTDSPSWRAYTGQTLDEWLGYGWLDAIHPDDRAYAERQWREAVSARGLVNAEFRLRAPGGGWRWTNVRAAPLLDADGGVVKWLGLNIDIDDRKEAEAALRESEERHRALFESMDEAYAVVEVLKDDGGRWKDFRYLQVNRAFLEHTDMPWPVGKTATELLGSPNPRWTELFGHALDSGRRVRVEESEAALGRIFDLNIFSLDRGRNRVAVLFANITGRKQAEAALRESEERQGFLLELSDALRPLADPVAIQQIACTIAGRQLGVDRVQFSEVDAARLKIVSSRDLFRSDRPSQVGEYDLSVYPDHAQAWLAGTTLAISDVASDRYLGEAERKRLLAHSVLSALTIPLLKNGVLVAVIAAMGASARSWSERDRAFLTETADRTWAAVERARAETALRQSEARLAAAFESVPAGIAVFNMDGKVVLGNEEYRRFLPSGLIPSRDPERGRRWQAWDADGRAIPPGNWPSARALRGEPVIPGQDMLYTDDDGQTVWTSVATAPVTDAAGQVTGCVSVISDITERKRAEAALRESEGRFQQFAAASSDALWIRDADTFAFEYVSTAVATVFGVEPERVMADDNLLNSIILPEERDAVSRRIERIAGGERLLQEYRIRRPSDGAFRWIRSTGFPLRNEQGDVRRIGAIAADITESRQLAEHQAVLLSELQHRVRNIMGMIRSMANRTKAGASSIDDYSSLLEGRLLALARVQTLLTGQANIGGSLRNVLEGEIAAQAHHGSQLELTGPDVMLSPKAVEVLTLAFHELATNALKYGALSVTEGRVAVCWTPVEKHGSPWISLDWIETGTPPREPSKRRGFGSELIERRIPYELGGSGKITIAPEGARCHLEFPLRNGESILETDAPRPAAVLGGVLDMTGAPDLTGKTVLVVEDDYYQAADTVAALRGAGAKVLGPCANEETARDLLGQGTPTHAVLDLNLGGGGPNFNIAQLMRSRGIPFIFVTGYDPDVVPEDLRNVVRLQKPVDYRAVVEALGRL